MDSRAGMTKTRRILMRGGDGTSHLSLLFGSSGLVWLGSVRREASWRIGAKDILAVLHMQYHKVTEALCDLRKPYPFTTTPKKKRFHFTLVFTAQLYLTLA